MSTDFGLGSGSLACYENAPDATGFVVENSRIRATFSVVGPSAWANVFTVTTP